MGTLKRAKELVDEILELTQKIVLTGEKENAEAEADAFSELIYEREPLIDELTDLRLQIDTEEAASLEFEEIKKIITHLAIMEKLRNSAQKSYKGVKQGQRIHAGYNPLQGDEASSKFDIKH